VQRCAGSALAIGSFWFDPGGLGAEARRKSKLILTTFIVAAFAVVPALNLSLGDKQRERKIESLYAVTDAQFVRTLGATLGPALVAGNRAEVLLIGEQIASVVEKLWEPTAGLFGSQL